MPEGRPYSLGNTSADYASINATSEMSASSRPRGRAAENPRAVSYENEASYAAPSQSLPAGRSAGPKRGAQRGAGCTETVQTRFRKSIRAALTSSGRSC